MVYPLRKPRLFTFSSPNGFQKINGRRSFLEGISAIGTAKEVTVFRKRASRSTFHLAFEKFLATERTFL
jgi:hypothetical protein